MDNSFSIDGKVTTAFGTGIDRVNSIAIQPDGRVVVAGFAYNGTNYDFAVARYISGLDIGVIEILDRQYCSSHLSEPDRRPRNPGVHLAECRDHLHSTTRYAGQNSTDIHCG
ncbi:MAG: hypothetical protein IPG11_15840 [Flavobacteriales bacterium]|nr:hypothetical protein [Flavobacteriales bacterium]